LPNGELKVQGPFETFGEVIGDVVVRFLIMGDRDQTPILGTATVAQADLTTSHAGPEAAITKGMFRATVPNAAGLTAGERVRGIGLAVAIKSSDSEDPPAFETFTWCVNLVVAVD
jgi:hypothetical protein